MQATDRDAVTQASFQIDRLLLNDPEQMGVDWGGDRYVEVEPLAVIFTVQTDDRQVRILSVWLLV
jgi:hypothetical protein